MAWRFNFRRVKIHHSYTVSELAELLGAHRQTVRRWIAAKQLPEFLTSVAYDSIN